MAKSGSLEVSLAEWLEKNLLKFLTEVRQEFSEEVVWQMPVIEDYVLVVSAKDYADGGSGTFTVSSENIDGYRIQGLLHDALN